MVNFIESDLLNTLLPEDNIVSLEDSFSLEARNVLKDSQLRVNQASQGLYTTSVTENKIIFSLTADQRKTFELYADILKGRGGILVPKLKTLYYPYKAIFKLPGKNIIDNYNNTVKTTTEEGSKYGIKRVAVRESLLTNFSIMYDFSKELGTLKKHTIDKTPNSMTLQRRNYILDYIKKKIVDFPEDPSGKIKYTNKVVFIDGPFFEGTKIRLNIQNQMLINIFRPGLLIIDWIFRDIDSFKDFLVKNKVSFVFRSAKDSRSLVLTYNPKVLKTKLFNPIFIMKALHLLDGTKDPEMEELTEEEREVLIDNPNLPKEESKESKIVKSTKVDPKDSVGQSEEEKELFVSDDTIDDIAKKELEIEEESEENDDIDEVSVLSKPSAKINETITGENVKEEADKDEVKEIFENEDIPSSFDNIDDLEEENPNVKALNEKELQEVDEDTIENLGVKFMEKRNKTVGTFEDVLEQNNISKKDKVDKILEIHNFSSVKNSIETGEVKKLKKKLQSSYDRKVEDAVEEIKKHKIPSTRFKNMEQNDYSRSNFINIEKTYKESVGKKDFEDIIACGVNSSNAPLFLTSYKETPVSTREFYGKTITAKYKDTSGNEHEITLDYPETIDGKLLIGGSLKQLNLQDAAKVVIKTDQDVIIKTPYNTVFLSLNGSFGSKEDKRIVMSIYDFVKNGGIGFVTKTTTALGNFIYKNQVSYELIHLNRFFNKFLAEGVQIDFRGVHEEEKDTKVLNESMKGKTILGHIRGFLVYHEPESNTYYLPVVIGRNGNYKLSKYLKMNHLSDFIIGLASVYIYTIDNDDKRKKQEELLNKLYKDMSKKKVTNSKINAVYARIMSRSIPVVFLMLIASPLNELLDRLKKETGLEYKIVKGKREELDKLVLTSKERVDVLHFANDISLLVKYNGVLNEIILAPLMELDLSDEEVFNINNIIRDIMKSSTTILYMENFVDYFISDPTTQRVLKLYNIPSDFVGLMIYASSLFTTHVTKYKSDASNYRLITPSEIVNRCLYDVLSKEFSGNAARVKMASRSRVNIPKDALLRRLQELPNMSEYSVISPFRSIMRDRKKSPKGQNGTNNSRAFDTTLRMFHDNNIGAETASTPYSGEAGVTKTLPVNPSIDSVSGEYKQMDLNEAYDDPSKVLSFIESYVPYLYYDHIIRAMMADNQFDHALPPDNADPMYVSYGADESAPYLSPSFTLVAKDDGEVISSNETYTKVKYKNGEVDIISMDEDERNADKGYFVPNKIKLSDKFKPGSKFKKGDLVAYNKLFFRPKSNGRLGLSAGPVANVCIVDSEGTWEDACIPFDSLSEKLTTSITKRVAKTLSLNTEIRDFNTNLNSVVNADDILFKYKLLEDDESLNDFFVMSEDLSMTDVKADNHGIIKDIRVYYRTAKDVNMSSSMESFIKEVTRKQKSINHAGDLDDVTNAFKRAKYNKLPTQLTQGSMSKINGDLLENGQILIEYYIESKFKLGSGDKIVVDRALKGEPSDILPNELRSVGLSSGRKADLLFNTYSLLARITPGMILHGSLIAILRHIAIKNRMILNRRPEPGHRLDYKSSYDMVEGKLKYKD